MDPLAIGALFISVIALGSSIYFGWCTRDHNRRSVRPLVNIVPADYEHRIRVRLRNNGTGPLLLQGIVADHQTRGKKRQLIDHMPPMPDGLSFKIFEKPQPGRSILPNAYLDLLVFDVDQGDQAALAYRDALRQALGQITIYIQYTDLYDTKFKDYQKSLKWFKRGSA